MRGAIAPGEAWLLSLPGFDSVPWGSPQFGICMGSVSGVRYVVFRKDIADVNTHVISVAGPIVGKVWTYDYLNDEFVAVDIPSQSARTFAYALRQKYGITASSGDEIIVEQMTKEQIGFRLT